MSITRISLSHGMTRLAGVPRILAVCLILAIHLPGRAAGQDVLSCEISGVVSVNNVEDVYRDEPTSYEIFLLNVSEVGVLILEVSDLGRSTTLPVIDAISRDCGRAAVVGTLTRRSAARRVVKVEEPGTWYFRVGTRRPRNDVRPGVYRLRVGFAEGRDLPVETIDHPCFPAATPPAEPGVKEVDEWDPEILTLTGNTPQDCRTLGRLKPATKEVDEWDPEILTLTIEEPGILELAGRGRQVLATVRKGRYFLNRMKVLGEDPQDLHAMFYPVCGLGKADDHGDSFACATAVRLGARLAAQIEPGDFDIFSFQMDAYGTVAFATGGAVDTFGQLFDDNGVRLAADDDGGGRANFRIVRSLLPGRYFLRVEGVGAAAGRTVLTVAEPGATIP